MTSLKTIQQHPRLLIFPALSSAALIMVCLTFFGGMAAAWGLNFDEWADRGIGKAAGYVFLFGFYLVSYFVIVFFNVGLVYSARQVFNGEEVSLGDAIRFSLGRVGTILSWAILAATVGTILKAIQENAGWLGKIVVGLVGIVWSIATFFVVPVLAFEDVSPFDAVKRSGQIMRQKWGESLAANFGFGIFLLVGYVFIIAMGFLLGYTLHPIVGVLAGIVMALLLHATVSAAETVFLAATYQHLHNEPHGDFSGETLDSVFVPKNR